MSLTYTCYLAGVLTTIGPISRSYFSGDIPVGGYDLASANQTGVTIAGCENLVSIYMTVTESAPTSGLFMGAWTWRASLWRSNNGGYNPATTVTELLPPGYELPIICVVDPEGADILELIADTVADIVAWVPCMLIPVGWDRADKIGNEWRTGSIDDLSSAFDAAIPGGIACGTVGTFSLPSGAPVVIDTCEMDVAPDWVKIALSGVIIIGVAALAIKRVMWAVGSKG